MNIKITIRLQDNQLQDLDDKYLVFDKSKSYFAANALLTPMYALPSDVSDVFIEEAGIYEQVLYRILFEGSLEIDSYLTSNLITQLGLSPEIAFYIKRRYVICYATFNFAKLFYRDYLKSVKKSKFLADVKVSLEVEREPELIKGVQADAADCMKHILDALGSSINMQSFVKGECNPCNKTAARLWFPSLGGNFPEESLATSKYLFRGKPHKVGDQGYRNVGDSYGIRNRIY